MLDEDSYEDERETSQNKTKSKSVSIIEPEVEPGSLFTGKQSSEEARENWSNKKFQDVSNNANFISSESREFVMQQAGLQKSDF